MAAREYTGAHRDNFSPRNLPPLEKTAKRGQWAAKAAVGAAVGATLIGGAPAARAVTYGSEVHALSPQFAGARTPGGAVVKVHPGTHPGSTVPGSVHGTNPAGPGTAPAAGGAHGGTRPGGTSQGTHGGTRPGSVLPGAVRPLAGAGSGSVGPIRPGGGVGIPEKPRPSNSPVTTPGTAHGGTHPGSVLPPRRPPRGTNPGSVLPY